MEIRVSDSLGWSSQQIELIDQAIDDEVDKARIAAKFLPKYPGPLAANASTVPADELDFDAGIVNNRKTLALCEISANFYLDKQQVREENKQSALALFRRAANVVARLEDAILFLGQPEVDKHNADHLNLPKERIAVEAGYENKGLVNEADETAKIIKDKEDYGPKIVKAVAEAIGILEGRGYSAPFALVLSTSLFTEALNPSMALVLPKDRIDPLVDGNFWRSGVLHDDHGVLISLGGDPVDLAVAEKPTAEILRIESINNQERYVCRVYERFALRIKQKEALVRIELESPQVKESQNKEND